MDRNELVTHYTQKLESLLARDYAARGSDLGEKLRCLEGSLPAELEAALKEIAGHSRELRHPSKSNEDVMDFIFACGQAFEQLDSLRRSRIAENLSFVPANGLPPGELEKTDMDAVARFIATRDRLMKGIANFMLKFLLVVVGLLILGVLIGVI